MKFFRFLYLNTYVFVLLALAVLIFLLPIGIFVVVMKYLCVLMCAAGAVGIFSQWKAKTGKIPILVQRNRKKIRPDTFADLQRTLCGRLVTSLALRDLRKTEAYRALSAAEWKELKSRAMGKESSAVRKDRERRRRSKQ